MWKYKIIGSNRESARGSSAGNLLKVSAAAGKLWNKKVDVKHKV